MAATFGKRGVAPEPQAARPLRVAPAATAAPATASSSTDSEAANLLAGMPLLTVALLILLAGIYAFEVQFAFHQSADAKLDLDTLLAFGAASRNRVFGDGEWWRLFLAPLLHSSNSHLIGNSVAMLLVGWRLEGLIGRGWYGLIFALGGLGGVTASMIGNPPDLVTVGASGAITALTAALFVLSWHREAAYNSGKLRRVALMFGAPALLPLLVGHDHSHVDYQAHLGGAMISACLGLALQLVWDQGEPRPAHGGLAGLVAFAMFGASVASAGAIISHYGVFSAHAARLASDDDLHKVGEAKAPHTDDLVQNHPLDPRTHLLNAISLIQAKNLWSAEQEARKALELIDADPQQTFARLKPMAQMFLGITLGGEGRRSEAIEYIRLSDACHTSDAKQQVILRAMRLCP